VGALELLGPWTQGSPIPGDLPIIETGTIGLSGQDHDFIARAHQTFRQEPPEETRTAGEDDATLGHDEPFAILYRHPPLSSDNETGAIAPC